jgi:alcohol dehydrogenase class IV
MSSDGQEIIQQLWTERKFPFVSYGIPYPDACAKHVFETFHASRVYIIASGTLSRNGNQLDRLIEALGKEHVVGVRKGMAPHTLHSEVSTIIREVKKAGADCLVTLGGGSLTDAAKLVALVSKLFSQLTS